MICFAAITPHSPLLVPGVGKENLKKLDQTINAMSRLSEDLYASHPDTIVVISGHATQHEKAFSINLHYEYLIDFKDFGDLSTTRAFKADLELATDIQRHMQAHEIPITLDSSSSLDYGTGVPLYFLTQSMTNVRVIPLSYCGLAAKDHVAFGRQLKDVLEHSHKRIAIIASGDLSHCLSSNAPMGFKPEGEAYDKKILEAVGSLSTSGLLSMNQKLVEDARACVQEQLLILFGIIERKYARVEILSYEHPFGVGYLVAQIHL
jgi:MEMO1 family protein